MADGLAHCHLGLGMLHRRIGQPDQAQDPPCHRDDDVPGLMPPMHPRLSARDALHLAIMERHGVRRIMSFDSGFDGFPGVERVS
jgi:hypothetical protein